MVRLLTPYLLLSSCLFLTLASCRYHHYQSYQKTDSGVLMENALLPVIPNDGQAQKYKASIDVLNKHYSGLVILKQTDSLVKHLVFVTELGMKMFDIEIKDTSMNMAYVFEPLNKPGIIKLLKNDFRSIMLLHAKNQMLQLKTKNRKDSLFLLKLKKQTRFYTFQNRNQLHLQEQFKGRKRQTRIEYRFSDSTQSYQQINFKSYGFVKVKIELTEIPKTHE